MFVTSNIHDPIRFAEYRKEMQVFVSHYGCKYLARGDILEVLEGKFDTDYNVLIAEYPDVDTIKKMQNSNEYKEIKKLREGAGDVNVFIIDGNDMVLSNVSSKQHIKDA